jgi:hypothetical protein
MLLGPLLLSIVGGCSRRIVEFVSALQRLLFFYMIDHFKLGHVPGVQAIITQAENLPVTLHGMKSLASLGHTSTKYVCCHKCWALYIPGTMFPVIRPADLETPVCPYLTPNYVSNCIRYGPPTFGGSQLGTAHAHSRLRPMHLHVVRDFLRMKR